MSSLSEILKVRIEPELREALERQAAEESRDISQLVRVRLRAAMVEDGQLEPAVQRG